MAKKHGDVKHAHKSKKVKHEALDAKIIKEELIDSNIEARYDKLFEQKLAEQYKEFRELKEHSMQMKKFVRALMVIITIIILALLLLTFS